MGNSNIDHLNLPGVFSSPFFVMPVFILWKASVMSACTAFSNFLHPVKPRRNVHEITKASEPLIRSIAVDSGSLIFPLISPEYPVYDHAGFRDGVLIEHGCISYLDQRDGCSLKGFPVMLRFRSSYLLFFRSISQWYHNRSGAAQPQRHRRRYFPCLPR